MLFRTHGCALLLAGGLLLALACMSHACGNHLVLDSGGRLVIAGYREEDFHYSMAVWRVLSDGTPDPGFGSGGSAVDQESQFSFGTGLAIDETARIFVAGPADCGGAGRMLTVWRLTPDGQQDQSWGEPNDLVLDLQGRLVITGTGHSRLVIHGAMGPYT